MDAALQYLARPSVEWTILWVLLAALVLFLFLRRPRTLVLAKSDAGKLEISRHALNRLLEACCEQLTGVASARAHVTRRGGKLCTRLRLKVRPEAKLDAIQGYLTEEIAGIYRENLGLADQVGPVHIEVVNVLPAEDTFTGR
jgi:hypothetical protein